HAPTGDLLQYPARQAAFRRCHSLASGIERVEKELVDLDDRMGPVQIIYNPAGRLALKTGHRFRCAQKLRPPFFKGLVIFHRFDENNKFMHSGSLPGPLYPPDDVRHEQVMIPEMVKSGKSVCK